MSDSESPKALISGFYGPGAFACWICQFISLAIAPKRSGKRAITLDFLAFVAYPTVATMDSFVKLVQLYIATRNLQPGEVDAKVVQLAIAWRAAFRICTYAFTVLLIWSLRWDMSQPWTKLGQEAVHGLYMAVGLAIIMPVDGLTFHNALALVSLSAMYLLFLHQLGSTSRTALNLRWLDDAPAHTALGILLYSPIFAMIAMIALSVSSMSSSGTSDAASQAEEREGLNGALPAFNHSITELDQAFSLLTGLLTVAWSAGAFLRDRGHLKPWAPNSLFSAEARPRQSAPPEAAIRPPPAALRRRQTNST